MPQNPQGGPFNYYIPKAIRESSWVDFYEVCQVVYQCMKQVGYDANAFASNTNAYWGHNGIAWKYDASGAIVRARPEEIETNLRKAKTCLVSNPKFQSADVRYSKAIGHLNRHPPDYANAVDDAMGAVEQIAKVVAGKSNGTLSELIMRPPFKDTIHGTILLAISKLYAYRGDQAEHQNPEDTGVKAEEAELVVSMASSIITYIASKFPLE